MLKMNIKSFEHILQDSIKLKDKEWIYEVPDLPPLTTLNPQLLIICISLVSAIEKQQVVLRLQIISSN